MPNKPPHGNAKDSLKKQHLYEIKDAVLPDDDNTFKYGVSGSALNKDGSSPRANAQVNQLNKKQGFLQFFASLLKTGLNGRMEALEEENQQVKNYKDSHDGSLPPGMKRPNPKK
jgi:hypothetical protein